MNTLKWKPRILCINNIMGKNKAKKSSKATTTDKTENTTTVSYPSTIKEGKKHSYNFWKNKPVSTFNDFIVKSEKIEDDLTKRAVYNNNSIALPAGMVWKFIAVDDDKMLNKVISFLQRYYLIDAKEKFRLDYSVDFVKWTLGKEGFMIAIVAESSGTICGVVGTSFKTVTVFDKVEKFANVNFLCAHPIYRGKKIAFTLIDEIVRLIVKSGVHQGCFTTERCVPTPITKFRYYHRPINYIKLQKFGFTELGGDPEKVQKKFELKHNSTYVPLSKIHIKDVHKLYEEYMKRYNIYCIYTQDELEELLLNKFVKSFVLLKDDQVIDFTSYYELASTVSFNDEMNEKETVDKINSAYLFLFSCCNTACDEMLENILKLASANNIDVFNVTDSMGLSDILLIKDIELDEKSEYESYEHVYEHKFLKGTGKLYLNFFNWKCPQVKPSQTAWISF